MKRLLLISLLGGTLLFTGCGGGEVTSSLDTSVVSAGATETLSSGDSIVRNSEDTEVIVRHVIESNTKEVEVLSGSITLIKGNY